MKNDLSTVTSVMATKLGSLGRVLTSGRRFRTQTPELSQTSCFSFFLLLVIVFGRTNKRFLYMFHTLLRRKRVTRTRLISLNLLGNVSVGKVPLIRNFVCESMTCHVL